MAKSEAKTVAAYLKELPADRRAVVSKVREIVLENLPKGYEEQMTWGMISYEIPLERYPDTYNKKPFSFVALAAQKNYFALYLNGVARDAKTEKTLAAGFEKIGRKMDMGVSCIRFKTLDDIPLDVIGKLIASTPVERAIEYAEAARRK